MSVDSRDSKMAQQRGGDKQVNIKLLTIGDSAVGKTCLISQFARDSFNPNFITTIGIDYKIKPVEIDGKKYKLLIWDTAGQERFRSVTRSYYRNAAGALIFYAINDSSTFDHLNSWLVDSRQMGRNDISVVVAGNKSDLKDQHQFDIGELSQVANSFGHPAYASSAKTGENVELAFIMLGETLLESRV